MNVMQAYGDKQEKDVAFHLRRAFKDIKDILVFHDVRLELDGENAQIDHLILHKFGFIVIESKSIHGEVKVNEHREWSRSYEGRWYGLASPIQQAENQTKILKKVLRNNATNLLGKVLGLQGGFGLRRYDVLIAVSSSAIIDRKNMPEDASRLIVKSEFIPEQVSKVIKSHGRLLSTNPSFNKEELSSIAAFLATNQSVQTAVVEPVLAVITSRKQSISEVRDEVSLSVDDRTQACCKHCNKTTGLDGRWGKFGYFVACSSCLKNTPLKRACPRCQGETKLKKNHSIFALNCASCGEVGKIIVG